MTTNDVLRRLRYIFDFNDSKMIKMFELADYNVTREQVSNWLKKDEDPDYQRCTDLQLATFLNGLISHKRGKKEGPQPTPERKISNNIIFKKIKIVLNLKDQDIMDLLELAEYKVGKHELSAFFRKPGTKNYRTCQDQVLRKFLKGVQLKYREN